MKRHTALASAVMAIALVASGAALAQSTPKTTGTESGTDTSKSTAGTGNAGDRTTEPGTGPTAPRKMHHKRAKKAADAASAGQ